MSFLLDTNALSEMRKIRLGRADPKLAAWSEQVSARDLFVSVITLQEIEQGLLMLQRRDAAQAGPLRHWFDAQVLPLFAGRTLPVTTEIALCCARLNVPDPKPYRDGLIQLITGDGPGTAPAPGRTRTHSVMGWTWPGL